MVPIYCSTAYQPCRERHLKINVRIVCVALAQLNLQNASDMFEVQLCVTPLIGTYLSGFKGCAVVIRNIGIDTQTVSGYMNYWKGFCRPIFFGHGSPRLGRSPIYFPSLGLSPGDLQDWAPRRGYLWSQIPPILTPLIRHHCRSITGVHLVTLSSLSGCHII